MFLPQLWPPAPSYGHSTAPVMATWTKLQNQFILVQFLFVDAQLHNSYVRVVRETNREAVLTTADLW